MNAIYTAIIIAILVVDMAVALSAIIRAASNGRKTVTVWGVIFLLSAFALIIVSLKVRLPNTAPMGSLIALIVLGLFWAAIMAFKLAMPARARS